MLAYKSGFIEGIRLGLNTQITGSKLALSTANAAFGKSSLNNNGTTGNYMSVTPFAPFAIGTGDFTFEFLYNPPVTNVFTTFLDTRPTNTQGNYMTFASNYPSFNSQFMYWVNGASRIQTANNVIVANTWQAVALVRYAGVTKIYVNGIASGTSWTDTTNYLAGGCLIASNKLPPGSAPLNGYMDEIRFSNVARYTANYTPATQPFTDDPNTILLLHCEGANGSITIVDDNT